MGMRECIGVQWHLFCSCIVGCSFCSGRDCPSMRVFFMLYNLEQLWPSLQENWDFFFFLTEIAWCFNSHFVYMRSFHFLPISLGTEHSSQVPWFYYTGSFSFFWLRSWRLQIFLFKKGTVLSSAKLRENVHVLTKNKLCSGHWQFGEKQRKMPNSEVWELTKYTNYWGFLELNLIDFCFFTYCGFNRNFCPIH